MATTQVAVCNRALGKLGSARITDISEDSRQARALNACWDHVRDLVLRSFRWQFALKRAQLAASATAPAFGFKNQFVLPSDFLQVDFVGDYGPTVNLAFYESQESVDYAIEGNMILTDFSAPLNLRYIAQISDPGQWDISFAEVMACKLAMEIAEEITQSSEKRQLAAAEYKAAVLSAMKANAVGRPPVVLPDQKWIIGRL
jgi:hypothetical protein